MFNNTYCFDDVLLVPNYSDIETRANIDIGASIGTHDFSLPVISSPMDTVTESAMVRTMHDHGGLGIIHRYNTIEDQCKIVRSAEGATIAAAIGVSSDFLDRARAIYDAGAKIVCIDVAHGHHTLTEKAIKSIKDAFGESMTIIAGNVATPDAFKDLSDWGADAIRVGIGGGSICSTRTQTGHGVPTFHSVLSCAYSEGSAKLIADGGIRSAGDVVKAIAAGADFVMLGSMLAGTDETPSETYTSSEGNRYKVYRGMASQEAQIAWRGESRSLEGVSTTIPYKGPVSNIIDKLERNVKSGFSYSGARTQTELRLKAKFIVQSSSAQAESGTHILNVK